MGAALVLSYVSKSADGVKYESRLNRVPLSFVAYRGGHKVGGGQFEYG